MGKLSIVVLALTLWSCKRQASPTVFVDPALATLIPPDTIALAGIRLQQIQKTEFFRKYVEERPMSAVERFRDRTGLDIRRDIWELLFASDGKNNVALVRGKFAEMGMEPRIAKEGAQRFGYKGFTLLGDENNVVAFIAPSIAVAGSPSAVHGVIDRRNETSGIPKSLRERVDEISAAHQIWFVAQGAGHLPGLSENSGPLNTLSTLSQSVQFVSGGLEVRHGLKGYTHFETKSAAEATRISDAVKALIGMARLGTPNGRRDLIAVYDALTATASGNEASVHLDLSPEHTEAIVRLVSPMLAPR